MITDKLNDLVSSYLNPVIVIDLQGNIIRTNAAFKNTKISIDKSIFEIQFDNTKKNILKLGFKKKLAFELNIFIEKQYCRLNFIPVSVKKKIYYMVVFNFFDENSLLNTVSFYEKTNVMEDISKKIIHDINNSIGGITGGLSLIQFKLAKDNNLISNEFGTYFDTMNKSVEKTLNILSELKDLTVCSSNINEFDLKSIIDNALNMEHYEDVSIRLNIKEDEVVKTDFNVFINIISNLIKNSIESIKSKGDEFKGVISINTENILLDDGSSFIKLTIADNGNGISNEDLYRVFNPYFTTKKINQKRGIGLTQSILHSFELGIILEIKSELSKGTEVTLYLPNM